MAGLKIKLDGEQYTIDMSKITLGEGRFLKKHFGMTSYEELTIIDPDPDIIVGILAVAIKREHPELDEDEIVAKVEAIPQGDFFVPMLRGLEAEAQKAREAAEKDPQSAGANGSAPAAKNGSSATTRKKRGPARSVNAA
jgi:hypothetical protein